MQGALGTEARPQKGSATLDLGKAPSERQMPSVWPESDYTFLVQTRYWLLAPQ